MRTKLALAGLSGLAALLTVTAGCTPSSGTGGGASPSERTRTVIETQSPSAQPTAPLSSGPTTTATASSCPLLGKQSAADRVGMRLDRITVQRSGSRVVGCRFYALQNSPLHNSEHLPGPNQPAVEITTTRYPSAVAAHNAFVLLARTGTNPQQATIATGNTGVCYQTDFFAADRGTDWACAFSAGSTAVVVRTVVVSPALNVILVAREVVNKI